MFNRNKYPNNHEEKKSFWKRGGKNDPEVFNEVYAGPGYFNDGDEEPEDAPEEVIEEEPDDIEEAGGNGVGGDEENREGSSPDSEGFDPYGPVPPPQDSRMFMTVYGGPEFFNGGPSIGAWGPPIQPAEKKDVVKEEGCLYCPSCGVKVLADQKFCSECGTVLHFQDPGRSATL